MVKPRDTVGNEEEEEEERGWDINYLLLFLSGDQCCNALICPWSMCSSNLSALLPCHTVDQLWCLPFLGGVFLVVTCECFILCGCECSCFAFDSLDEPCDSSVFDNKTSLDFV